MWFAFLHSRFESLWRLNRIYIEMHMILDRMSNLGLIEHFCEPLKAILDNKYISKHKLLQLGQCLRDYSYDGWEDIYQTEGEFVLSTRMPLALAFLNTIISRIEPIISSVREHIDHYEFREVRKGRSNAPLKRFGVEKKSWKTVRGWYLSTPFRKDLKENNPLNLAEDWKKIPKMLNDSQFKFETPQQKEMLYQATVERMQLVLGLGVAVWQGSRSLVMALIDYVKSDKRPALRNLGRGHKHLWNLISHLCTLETDLDQMDGICPTEDRLKMAKLQFFSLSYGGQEKYSAPVEFNDEHKKYLARGESTECTCIGPFQHYSRLFKIYCPRCDMYHEEMPENPNCSLPFYCCKRGLCPEHVKTDKNISECGHHHLDYICA